MKKQLFILLVSFFSCIHAGDLTSAIEASDLQEVLSLVSHRSFTEKELIRYLDFADKMIALRRDQMTCAQMGKLGYFPEGAQAFQAALSMVIASVGFMYLSAPFFAFHQNKWQLSIGVLSIGASIASAFKAHGRFKKAGKLVEEKIASFPRNHSNALKIRAALMEKI